MKFARGEVDGNRLLSRCGCGEKAAARIQAAYEIGEAPPSELPQLIKEVIE